MFTDVVYFVRIWNGSVLPVTIGNASVIQLDVSGSPEFSVSIEFGDGSVQNTVTDEDSATVVMTNDVTVYRLTFTHIYARVGRYPVSVTVGNPLSKALFTTVALVSEEPPHITLTSNSSTMVVGSGSVVMAIATVVRGQYLEFSWLNDPCFAEPPLVFR